MRTDEIIALLEDMCERPLDTAADSTALRAFCREAVRRLELDRAEAGVTEASGEAEALTALLATVISGRGTDADRAALSAALSRATSLRLEASAATSFIEAIAHAPHSAPADLVDELVAEGNAKAVPARARRWFVPSLRRAVAACAVVVVAAGATWSIHRWQQEPAESADDVVLKKSAPLKPLNSTVTAPAQTPAPPPPAVSSPSPAASVPPAPEAPTDVVAPAARQAAPAATDFAAPLAARRAAAPPPGAEMRRTVPTVAVTAKPVAPCPPPAASDTAKDIAKAESAPAQGAAGATPPSDCASPPANRFTSAPPGDGSAPAAAASTAPAKAMHVLRPTLTAPPVDGSLGRLVAPTPMTQMPRPGAAPPPVDPSPEPQSAPPPAASGR